MHYVIAAHESDYLVYCRTLDLNPRGRPPEVKRIREEMQLMGITLKEDDKIVITDYWWETRKHDDQSYARDLQMLARKKMVEAIHGSQ